MKLVNFKIVALLLITYCLALAVLFPISWIKPYVEPQLLAKGVRLNSLEGSIWNGKAVINEKNIGNANIEWDVHYLSLFLLKTPISIHAFNSDADLSGVITLSPFSFSVSELNGYLDEKVFKSIYQSYRADIKGRLKVDNINFYVELNQKLELGEASGSLSWSGGPIVVPVGRSSRTFEVPTMLGTISSDEQKWIVDIQGSDNQKYIAASLSKEGLATLSVKRVLASEMGAPISGNGRDLLDVSQQVF